MRATLREGWVWLVLGGVAVTTAYSTRELWLPASAPPRPSGDAKPETASAAAKVILSDQAIDNLNLRAKPIKVETTWKTLMIPGWIVHRPGLSDRGIVTPAAGTVAAIHRVPGDTVRAGDRLFTVKLLSESLHLSQADLFRTNQDLTLAEEKLKRLNKLAAIGTESQVGLAEAEGQVKRLQISSRAYRQELLNRGLTSAQVDGIAAGTFVNEMTIYCPPSATGSRLPNETPSPMESSEVAFEIQELKVELGQQVQAGQTLCLLANHQALAIEGKAFREELPWVERSYKESWPVEVDLQEESSVGWGDFKQTLTIRYIANTIDPVHRTFPFLMSLDNESKTLEREGGRQLLWRFRPGQRVRLSLRVEKLDNVFVVPADAVVQDGADAYAFSQNVNTFERHPVRLRTIDRTRAVLVNDGSLLPGTFVVQSGAAQLNRIVKSASGSGAPAGYHMHADGSLHKNGDPE